MAARLTSNLRWILEAMRLKGGKACIRTGYARTALREYAEGFTVETRENTLLALLSRGLVERLPESQKLFFRLTSDGWRAVGCTPPVDAV